MLQEALTYGTYTVQSDVSPVLTLQRLCLTLATGLVLWYPALGNLLQWSSTIQGQDQPGVPGSGEDWTTPSCLMSYITDSIGLPITCTEGHTQGGIRTNEEMLELRGTVNFGDVESEQRQADARPSFEYLFEKLSASHEAFRKLAEESKA